MPHTTNLCRLEEKRNSTVGFNECVVSVVYFYFILYVSEVHQVKIPSTL